MTMCGGDKQAKTLVGLRSLRRARFQRTGRKPALPFLGADCFCGRRHSGVRLLHWRGLHL